MWQGGSPQGSVKKMATRGHEREALVGERADKVAGTEIQSRNFTPREMRKPQSIPNRISLRSSKLCGDKVWAGGACRHSPRSPMKTRLHPEWRSDSLRHMSTKQQTLSWLAELPEEPSAWRELHDDARLLRDIAAAEDDVRNGRERPLSEARELLEQKWAQRRSKSA
jgi:hypothetical protein